MREATDELVEAIERLLPQLNEARTPPTFAQLAETVAQQTVLVARDDRDGQIIGTLTLVLYRVASGLKPLQYEDAPSEIPQYLPGRSWGTMGDSIKKMQLPADSSESIKHMAEKGHGNVIFLDGSADGYQKTLEQMTALQMSTSFNSTRKPTA